MLKKLLAMLLTALFFLSCTPIAEADVAEKSSNNEAIENMEVISDYITYIQKNKDFKPAEKSIEITSENLIMPETTARIEEDDMHRKVLQFTKTGSKSTFAFSCESDGIYNLLIEYATLDNKVADPQIAVQFDGSYYFDGMRELTLYRHWKNKRDDWRRDEYGNEYSSEQVEIKNYFKQTLTDNTGVITDPYQFALTKGKHTISVVLKQQSISIHKIFLIPPENVKKYSEAVREYSISQYRDYSSDNDIVIQGENADEKTAFSLTGKSDNISAEVFPLSPTKTLINYIGSTNWSSAGQSLIWKFTVPEDGLYELCFHYKQNEIVNGNVYRRLKIDGTVPFEEAKSICFRYETSWNKMVLSDKDGNACKFYLEKGEHTLELTVTVGEMADYYRALKEIVDGLSSEYLRITMITGETPDSNRDYELFKQIPDLENNFKDEIKRINTLTNSMEKMSQSSSTQYVSTLKSMSRILKQMLETKYLAHTHKTEFYNQFCSLSSMLNEMLNMPLSIDEIRFYAPGKDIDYGVPFFKRLGYGIKRFVSSFSNDYVNKEDKTLKLWVNWGRDQTQVLKTLIQESFTAKTGIDVDVQITAASIIQGMLTDNAPDIAIGVARSNPVNYAMRGAVYDLSSFKDFEEVKKSFNSGATEPYVYNGGCYALPDTQNFFIMFYRTDIMKQLNLSIPETWEEFMETSAVIQRNNMSVYLPYTKLSNASIVNAGVGSLNLFATLMTQNKLQFYDLKSYKSLLDTDAAIDVFDNWTRLYTKYKIPVEANFYNRFRIGVSPLGIAPYTLYTTLEVAAPEIKNKWGIALIPGTKEEDGSVDHSCAGSGSACFILNDSSSKKEAWEFLKWWTSSETQMSYSRNVESLIGVTGRIATSNIEAFSNYSWGSGDLEVLIKQWSFVKEIPEVPGSYYMARSVDQAFWAVVNGNSTASDALLKWNAVAGDEIKRKVNEYK